MGFDFKLYGHDCDDDASWFRLNSWAWSGVYHLAMALGWEPEGTEFGGTTYDVSDAEFEGLAKNWNGNYWTNDGQIVSESDAANLGAALDQAIRFTPTERLEVKKEDSEVAQAFCRFSGEGREYLEKFITFVKRGSFVIF